MILDRSAPAACSEGYSRAAPGGAQLGQLSDLAAPSVRFAPASAGLFFAEGLGRTGG